MKEWKMKEGDKEHRDLSTKGQLRRLEQAKSSNQTYRERSGDNKTKEYKWAGTSLI